MSEINKHIPAKTLTQSVNASKKPTLVPVILMDISGQKYPDLVIEVAVLTTNNGNREVKRVPLVNQGSLSIFKNIPQGVKLLVLAFSQLVINEKRDRVREQYSQSIDPRTWEEYWRAARLQYLFQAMQQLKPFLHLFTWYYISVDDLLLTTTVTRAASMGSFVPVLSFELVRSDSGSFRLMPFVRIHEQLFPLRAFKRHGFLLQSRSEFFLLSMGDVEMLDKMPMGYVDAGVQSDEDFLQLVVAPLAERFIVNKRIIFRREVVQEGLQCNVWLSELSGSFLMLRLRWQYGDFEIEDDVKEAIVSFTQQDVVYEVHRDVLQEKALFELVRGMHKKFGQQQNGYFYLPFADAEKGQWFVKCYQQLNSKNIGVYGMDQLKHFRYNTNVPVMHMQFAGDGRDWFDLSVSVSYGELKVPLADIQKAIIHKQPHLVLKDGTIGMIPEEWGVQYGLLLKIGEVNKEALRLSKLHWTITDDLKEGAEFTRSFITEDYRQKWHRLQGEQHDLFALPAGINAQLRDYQKAGFEWMCLMDEMQWGGCLADDMGLGKTLQAITFLQYLKEKYVGEVNLVVCPTSLIYNWENEIRKFAPTLRYRVYHGGGRTIGDGDWADTDVLITSYGTVRSDMELFGERAFGIVVLDESHVIKNPASLTTKAVQGLRARNRLILSGTPIQNNTLDLYAQMQFVNPGLLGNAAFFKAEFATPIDRFGDVEKSRLLRKMIYPFLLRRTKQQIAKDLPDKTEIILWCEMGEEQRNVYNRTKELYRSTLLKKIKDDGGVSSNTIYILEGLTRLRQICNSPRLVDKDNPAADVSVKLDELLREIEHNIGDHKALVFSQFTGMLGLIVERMKARGIRFLYLDGSTPAHERQQLVQQFQEEEGIRVFLISLKAGGVGLTLTAADYVYLVDPWWNPAAEQQAIDRTHRIGQQNKVFAYKMICRDSVEEKILELQQRKKALADDLISEETGFVKKLTADDVEFLFS